MDMGTWLSAVEAHPETTDTYVAVAIALAHGENHRDGISPEDFIDSVEELIALGFLEDRLSLEREHMLEFCLP